MDLERQESYLYSTNEIKYKIDTAIQMSMFETYKKDWSRILDVQRRLYEEFGIDDSMSNSERR